MPAFEMQPPAQNLALEPTLAWCRSQTAAWCAPTSLRLRHPPLLAAAASRHHVHEQLRSGLCDSKLATGMCEHSVERDVAPLT
jgi:hypothetical protein